MRLAGKGTEDRRRATELVAAVGPDETARGFVERSQARAVRRSKDQIQGVAFDHRRAGHSVPPLFDTEVLPQVLAPDFGPGLEIQTVQLPVRTEGIEAPVVDRRSRARTAVDARSIAELRGIRERPSHLARRRLHRLHDFVRGHAVKQHDRLAAHHGAGVSFADVPLPNLTGPFLWPDLRYIVPSVNRVTRRPKASRRTRSGAPHLSIRRQGLA